MNFNNRNGASFFKILLNDSATYLPLPSTFAKKYLEKGHKKKQNIVLKTNKSDEKWKAKYLNIEDRYYIMDGWFKFMKDNNLQTGDFLVFWLVSRSKLMFNVFVYAPNGCLKKPTSSSSNDAAEGAVGDLGNKSMVKEETNNDDDGLLSNVHKSFKRVVRKTYIFKLPMVKRYVKANGLEGYDTLRLKNHEGKIWDVKVKKYGPDQTPHLAAGWFEFKQDNKLKVGDTCEFYHVKSNLLQVRVLDQ